MEHLTYSFPIAQKSIPPEMLKDETYIKIVRLRKKLERLKNKRKRGVIKGQITRLEKKLDAKWFAPYRAKRTQELIEAKMKFMEQELARSVAINLFHKGV